jgi:dTDP-4-dehydrorhamnose 3,5-epimerase
VWFEKIEEALGGIFVLQGAEIGDERGGFSRLYCCETFRELIGVGDFAQINRSVTTSTGSVRGLHFQYPPHAELKVVRCLSGAVWDVAVDIRRASPTFLSWYGQQLSSENNKLMVIPEGFAHGFQVMEGPAELMYLHTKAYAPGSEGGLRFDDPAIGIDWPVRAKGVSDRDLGFTMMDDTFTGVAGVPVSI